MTRFESVIPAPDRPVCLRHAPRTASVSRLSRVAMASALHREALVLTGLSLVLIYLGALALFLRAASGQAGEPGPAVPAAAARHSAALGSQSNRATATARATASYASLPLSFEVNRGQADASIQFLSRGKGYVLLLTRSAALLSLKA